MLIKKNLNFNINATIKKIYLNKTFLGKTIKENEWIKQIFRINLTKNLEKKEKTIIHKNNFKKV